MDEREVVSLKEHIESRLAALEKASELAARALEKRLEGMNEFREALKNQANQFVTRAECEVRKQATNGDIRVLRESKAMLEGKASQLYVTICLAIALLGLVTSIISLVIHKA